MRNPDDKGTAGIVGGNFGGIMSGIYGRPMINGSFAAILGALAGGIGGGNFGIIFD